MTNSSLALNFFDEEFAPIESETGVSAAMLLGLGQCQG